MSLRLSCAMNSSPAGAATSERAAADTETCRSSRGRADTSPPRCVAMSCWMRHNHEHIRWVVARGVRSCPWTSGRSVSLPPVSRPPPAAVRVHLSGRTWNFHIPDRRLEPDRGAARCRNVALACLKAGNGPAPLPGTTTRALETSEVMWQPHRWVRHNTRTDPL